MAKWGFSLGKKAVLGIVQEYVQCNKIPTPFTNGRPRVDWFRSFMKRNKLKLKKVEQLESSRRANTSNPFLIYGFYDFLEETIRELDIFDKPGHIYNVDESGFLYDPKRQKGVVHESTSAHWTIMRSGKDTTTVCPFVSALGKYLPPLIIFEGKLFWSHWAPGGDKMALYAYADNGYMTLTYFMPTYKSWQPSLSNVHCCFS